MKGRTEWKEAAGEVRAWAVVAVAVDMAVLECDWEYDRGCDRECREPAELLAVRLGGRLAWEADLLALLSPDCKREAGCEVKGKTCL